MRILPAGADGVLVEVDDLDRVVALSDALREHPVPGVIDAVPAARTVYLRFARGVTSADAVADAVRSHTFEPVAATAGELVRIPVVYDGDDIDDVARMCGMDAGEVIARHSAAVYTVAFIGFAPGFAYLSGGDAALRPPRMSSPRTAIPAGAVALAGEFSGVYPRRSPGGWRLIGRTDAAMWDLQREPPALLRPGMRVEFTPVRDAVRTAPESSALSRPHPARGAGAEPVAAASAHPDVSRGAALEVVTTGGPALVQDLGRPGHADLGVSPSGAMDRAALRRANRLVGNAGGVPALETALGGLVLRASGHLVVAVTGAVVPLRITSRTDTRDAPHAAAVALDDGEVLEIGAPASGVYAYIAVRGGIDVPTVLGSASRDVLAALGPDPLRAGEVVPVGAARPPRVIDSVSRWPDPPVPLPQPGSATMLDVLPGPRDDWFDREALTRLTEQDWVVSEASNRTGLRLRGDLPLERIRHDELPSEGTARGSLQVPRDGQPVLFTADHPLTGGYPVIACVTPGGLDLAAQVPPGARIRFRIA